MPTEPAAPWAPKVLSRKTKLPEAVDQLMERPCRQSTKAQRSTMALPFPVAET
jgi:hypothetical protein